jgi:hypothetical protein
MGTTSSRRPKFKRFRSSFAEQVADFKPGEAPFSESEMDGEAKK